MPVHLNLEILWAISIKLPHQCERKELRGGELLAVITGMAYKPLYGLTGILAFAAAIIISFISHTPIRLLLSFIIYIGDTTRVQGLIYSMVLYYFSFCSNGWLFAFQ